MVSGKNIVEKNNYFVNNLVSEEGEIWHISHSQEYKQNDEEIIGELLYINLLQI